MSENIISDENLPFPSDNMIFKLSEFKDLLQELKVDSSDLNQFSNELVECDKFGDVLKLIASGNVDPLIALVTYCIMCNHNDETIKEVIKSYPNSLSSLRKTLDSTEVIDSETGEFRKFVQETIDQKGIRLQKKTTRMFADEKNTDDDVSVQKDLERISNRFQKIDPGKQMSEDELFRDETDMLAKGKIPEGLEKDYLG